ncbi:MAG: methyltransferase [Pseudomonadota bacterium]
MTLDITVTKDAFHRGAFHLIQPAKGAHRAGIDAMLLAACVPDEGAIKVADFGAGAGAVGFAIASRCKQAKVTLIERNDRMLDCAQKSLALKENAHLADRITLHADDITTMKPGTGHDQLPANHFDWVVMNPPFNEPGDRESPHADRAEAHVADDELFEVWVKKAATILHAKGKLAIIARPSSLKPILDATDRRFGALRVTPIHPRANLDAIRILVTGQKGSRERLAMAKGLVLQERADEAGFTQEVEALVNGVIALNG